MKLLRQLAIILIIGYLGEVIHTIFHLTIPGNVIGMSILFACLYKGIIKVTMIDKITDFLLDHLAFFFIPAGVGIVTCLPLLKNKWVSFIIICLITTVLIIVVTGWVIQLYIRRIEKND